MLHGVRGRLVSEYFLEAFLEPLLGGLLGESSRAEAHQQLLQLWRQENGSLGPASSVRALFDSAAAPLARHLGFSVGPCVPGRNERAIVAALETVEGTRLALLVAGWGEPLDDRWRDAVRHGIAVDAR